jgi:hypothetical protein
VATSEFRVYFDGTAATKDQLDQIETISVEQQIDMAWEARLEIPIRTSDDGSWTGPEQSFASAFKRIRVEIRIGDGSFVPLMDGPVVGADTRMSSQPGQSSQTVIVQDDSVYLNRNADIERFDDQADHEVARTLFSRVSQITTRQIEETPAPATSRSRSTVQRGTAMQILRELARRQGMHAYVLPGAQPGQSIGAFKSLPRQGDGLPDLILVGDDRNVADFHVAANLQQPSKVRTFALDVTDKTVTEAMSSFRNLELLGDEAALGKEQDAATRLELPGADDAVDPNRRVGGTADRDSFAFSATGSVLPECYRGVLAPYRVVRVRGVDTRLNGDYVIKRVSHRLTRSEYTQSFEFLRNAVARGQSAAGPLAGIF